IRSPERSVEAWDWAGDDGAGGGDGLDRRPTETTVVGQSGTDLIAAGADASPGRDQPAGPRIDVDEFFVGEDAALLRRGDHQGTRPRGSIVARDVNAKPALIALEIQR